MFKLFKDSAISLSYKLISVFLKFLLIYIITNVYGAENYGAYVFAISIFLFLNTLFRFGFDIYIQKFTAELLNVNNKNKAQLKFLQIASISVFTILIVTLLIKFYFIFTPDRQPLKSLYLNELIIYGSVYAFYWMTMYYFRGIGKGKTSVFIMEIVQPLTNIFILLIFINFFENLLLPSEKIIHSFGLSIIICLTIFTVLEKFNFLAFYNKSSFFKKTILLEINNSKAFLFISASGMLLAWVDTYIISFFVDNTEIGVYSLASKLSLFILFPVSAVSIFFSNLLVGFFAKNDINSISFYLKKISIVLFFSSLVIFLVINFFNVEILQVFGKDFNEGESVLLFLSFGYMVSAIFGCFETVILISKHKNYLFKLNIIMIILNILLNIPLVYFYGINGAAIGTLIVIIYSRLMQVNFVKRNILIND